MTKNKEATVEVEKSVEQTKVEGVFGRLKSFLADENCILVPVMRRTEGGDYADIELRLLAEPVKNIYDEKEAAN